VIIVVDASVLVGELLRARGIGLLRHVDLEPAVPEEPWSEARHELARRVAAMVEHGKATATQAAALLHGAFRIVEDGALVVVPLDTYGPLEPLARRRVPRDQRDWPPVALALVLEAAILTHDADFLGCGCPTWTVETLRAELAESG
jgi:predicted nucleic acid-binding protein